MGFKTEISKMLKSKLVLNVVVVVSVLNIIGHLSLGHMNFVMIFAVVALLVRYFSKNMIVVLGVPLIIVNLYSLKYGILEGMETQTDDATSSTTTTTADSAENAAAQKVAKALETKATIKANKLKTKLDISNSIKNQGASEDIDTTANGTENIQGESTEEGDKQGFEAGRRKGKGHEIDYATTIEDAYDELNNILGSDGIHKLSSDTQNLMQQQMKLAEAMKSMTPVIEQIAPMVNNLKGMMGQMGDSKSGMSGLLDMAKQMSGK